MVRVNGLVRTAFVFVYLIIVVRVNRLVRTSFVFVYLIILVRVIGLGLT